MSFRHASRTIQKDISAKGERHADLNSTAPDAKQRLDLLVSQAGRSKAFYLRELVERGIEDLEDYYLAAEA